MNYLRSSSNTLETVYRGHREFNTTVPCQTVKNGRPGRPWVDIPSEVVEDLRGLGFTWEKIQLGFSGYLIGQ